MSDSLQPLDCGPLSLGFSRQEHWSGLPWPASGDLPSLWIEHMSLLSPPLAGGSFTTRAAWEAQTDTQLSNTLEQMQFTVSHTHPGRRGEALCLLDFFSPLHFYSLFLYPLSFSLSFPSSLIWLCNHKHSHINIPLLGLKLKRA